MTNEELNKFYDGITAHNKEMLDRERDAIDKTVEFLGLCEKSILPHMKIIMYPEDSSFNDCGSKADSDPFFKRIDDDGIQPELLESLKVYLTEEELKERLNEDNYMSCIVVQDLIDAYLKRKKIKAIERKILIKEQDLVKTKLALKKFKEGTIYKRPDFGSSGNVQDLLDDHRERELYEFDFDKFLTEE